MKPFDHKTGTVLNTDAASIYFEESGNPEKPVLLLLHGGFGNIEDFNGIITKLKTEFRIVGIDSRGQGKSTLGDRTLSYEILQNDAEQVLRHLGIHELNIIGFSDGGIVAYRLASFTTLKIKKLITIGARWHKSNVVETKNLLSAVDANKWKEKFPEMFAAYERQNPNPDFDKLSLEVVKMWLNEASYPNETVKNIRSQTLIIRGDKDHLVKRKFAFDIAELIQNSNLANIAFAGHAVHVDQPEILMLTINEFLNK